MISTITEKKEKNILFTEHYDFKSPVNSENSKGAYDQ